MGKMHAEGVTLVELVIALAVVGVILSLGVPGLADFIDSNRMTGAANDLVSSVHLARSEAVMRDGSVVICASSNATSAQPSCDGAATFGAGWIVFFDANSNAQLDDVDVLINAHAALPAQITVNSRAGGNDLPVYMAFGADGFRLDLASVTTPSVANLQLCDHRGDRMISGGRAAGHWVQVSATGHPRVHVDYADVQGPRNPLGGCR